MDSFGMNELMALPLDELRVLMRFAEQAERDRQCMSTLDGYRCNGEPPHADGWHEYRPGADGWSARATGRPANNASPEPATVRWRFSDEVVAREHEFEAGRRPGRN